MTEEIINNILQKYKLQLENIKTKYKEVALNYNKEVLKTIIHEDRELIKKIIIDIASYFKELELADFIMLNGSYSRHSNIYNSDIDLNIMYQDKYKKILLPIELEINYILSRVLDFKGCDRIHSIMVYTSIEDSIIPVLKDNKLQCYSKSIPYFCRENYEKLLYETFNSSRDYNELIRYFRKNRNAINEWEKNFELVIDYGKYNDFVKKLEKLYEEKLKYFSKSNILSKEKKLLISSLNNHCELFTQDIIKVKDLKKNLKSVILDNIYKTVAILKYNNSEFIKIDLLENEEFKNSIYMYLCAIIRLQIVFDNLEFDISSHSSKEITTKTLSDLYQKIFNDNIESYTNKCIIAINNSIKKVLEEVSK